MLLACTHTELWALMSEIINIWAQHFEPVAVIPEGLGAHYVMAFRYSLRRGEKKKADVKKNASIFILDLMKIDR